MTVKEVIVPYVAQEHWSLFVFQPNQVYFFNWAKGRVHFPTKEGHEDKVFMEMVNKGWQDVREVERYEVDGCKVILASQQDGNHECGHHVLRNIVLYVKV